MKVAGLWAAVVLMLVQFSMAIRHMKSTSLLTCMKNSLFTASHFNVVFYPDNSTVYFDITAIANIDGYVGAKVDVIAYGINAISKNITFCSLNYKTICPFSSGHLELTKYQKIPEKFIKEIPSVAYTIPDLDARVRVVLYDTNNTKTYACVEAVLSNGKTVQNKYVSWPIAAVSGLGVLTSGVVSVIGHSNTAAHIASNSMSLFVYFQSLSLTAMLAVAKVPPIAAAWAQNFEWSLGIVRTKFVQDIANWYIQATGGTPTDILKTSYLSISVQKKIKRSAKYILDSFYNSQSIPSLSKRASVSLDTGNFGYSDKLDNSLYTVNEKSSDLSSKILILRGMQRVAYLAGIELTNLFMTSIMFLLFVAFVLVVCISAFKAVIEICIRSKILNEGRFGEYRQQWSYIIKGSLYRLLLLAFPQICVMCLWQFTENDSAGTIVIAVFLLAVVLILLFQASIRVFHLGRKSVRQFKNPAYLLYGDSKFLNKFGFIYVHYRADKYYFVTITLVYVLLKTLFIAVLQQHGRPQSVIVFAIELIYCVLVCWLRPFMDKRTNAFNITISIINAINALFFMFFSYIFNQPQIVASVMAVVYFVLNAVFALFLLLFTIISCVIALVSKNPDTRYQPMKDDRVSFLPRFDKSGKNVGGDKKDDMELMALGAIAMRGHENGGKPNHLLDEDESIYDEDTALSNHDSRRHNANVYGDDESESKRDSYYLEAVEPTAPTSTIVGNPNSAMNNYNTAYNRSVNFRTPDNLHKEQRNNGNSVPNLI